MTYIELKKEAQRLADLQKESIRVEVISDMPLQPWFDLFLQLTWAKLGKKTEIQRTAWADRHQKKVEESAVRILWPGPEAEVAPSLEKADIWITQPTYLNPISAFYGAAWPQEQAQQLPLACESVLDLNRVIAEVGLQEAQAEEERRWGDCYSRALQEKTAQQIVRLYETRHGRRKKCIVLDCDGVLWGGIISEDGMSGIQLAEAGEGKDYYEFQKLLKQLTRHGILLAVCSKNEEDDVRQVFQKHTAMALRQEDIAAWSVSWEPKSEQILKLAERLRMDPCDMVLIDDQQWEIAQVQSQLPKLGAICFQKERIRQDLAEQIWLLPEDQNEQNQLRLQTYQDDLRREKLREQATDYEDFLEKLNTRIRLQPAGEAEIARISDLSRRANRCTNGVRYSKEELQKRMEDDYELQAVFAEDIYRDLGLVGCIGIDRKTESLDLFCLSCRALGRRVENKLLAGLPEWIRRARWLDTGKNEWLRLLLQEEKGWEQIR